MACDRAGMPPDGLRRGRSMTVLILGLVLFLGLHSVRVFADDWRASVRTRIGAGPWKGL